MKISIAACLLAFIASCGGSSDPRVLTDDGSKALNSGDYSAAAESFDKALSVLGQDTANPEWMRAKLGAIQARTRLDAAKAKQEFLDFAAASPSKVTAEHYNLIGSKLGDAGHLAEAVAVLQAGMKSNPESVHLQALLTDLGKKAEAGGDAGALDSLRGLGYVGGGD